MEIIEEKQDAISIFKLNGRLDSNTSQGFEKKIFDAISDGSKNMIVDFKDLDYISSAGLRVILKATKALNREEGKIMLCTMQDYVKEVFEIAGFDSFLPIVATMDEALQSF
ncbi:MAG: STAS domain-containing protein [Deltaproteobacteria bacterium]|jgi:anti-sigma B factor antagonist|nr:STAS domain-containing protein [Deltaproteobacteria bacterium]